MDKIKKQSLDAQQLRSAEYKSPKVNAQPSNRTEQTKIRGILASNIRSRKSTDVPYMAFLRLATADFANHSLAECSASKCQDCEIPVVFRIFNPDKFRTVNPNYIQPEDFWLKPNLTKGQTVILEGTWAKSNGNRPSFTCYSYQVLEGDSK